MHQCQYQDTRFSGKPLLDGCDVPPHERAASLALIRRIDALVLKYPFYGSRPMARQLRQQGLHVVGASVTAPHFRPVESTPNIAGDRTCFS